MSPIGVGPYRLKQSVLACLSPVRYFIAFTKNRALSERYCFYVFCCGRAATAFYMRLKTYPPQNKDREKCVLIQLQHKIVTLPNLRKVSVRKHNLPFLCAPNYSRFQSPADTPLRIKIFPKFNIFQNARKVAKSDEKWQKIRRKFREISPAWLRFCEVLERVVSGTKHQGELSGRSSCSIRKIRHGSITTDDVNFFYVLIYYFIFSHKFNHSKIWQDYEFWKIVLLIEHENYNRNFVEISHLGIETPYDRRNCL